MTLNLQTDVNGEDAVVGDDVRHERVRGFCPPTSTLGILVYCDDSLSVRAYRRRCIEVR